MGVSGDGRKMVSKDPPPRAAVPDGGATDWYRKHRPRRWDGVLGQDAVVRGLSRALKAGTLPHAMIFAGPSGTGKNTAARILADRMGCLGGFDYEELDCAAVEEPLAAVRKLRDRAHLSGGGPGGVRLFVLDEVQALSRAGFAQQALLKMLEEARPHAYFVLNTTDPDKLLPTIRTRCSLFQFRAVSADALAGLAREVAAAEGVDPPPSEAVLAALAEAAEGSPRKLLVDLQAVATLPDDTQRLERLAPEARRRDAFELAKLLIWGHRPTWRQCCELIQKIDVQRADAEGFRWLVMACARKELLKGNPKTQERAFGVLDAFADPFFNTGEHGVLLACYRLFKQ